MHPDRRDDWPDSRHNPTDSSNPFIAFRHLVDQQIASAMHVLHEQAGGKPFGMQRNDQAPDEAQSRLFGIFSQPPLYERTLARSSSSQQQQQQHQEETLGQKTQIEQDRSWKPWWQRRRDGCPGMRGEWYDRDHGSTAHGCEGMKGSESCDRTEGSKFQAYRTHHESHEHNGPHAGASRMFPQTSYQLWRIASSYSPEHLVDDPSLPLGLRENCHEAFLDLMTIHNGEEMSKAAPKQQDRCSKHRWWQHRPQQDARTQHQLRVQFLNSQDKHNADWIEPLDAKESLGFPMGLPSFFASVFHPPFFGSTNLERTTSTEVRNEQMEKKEAAMRETEEDMYRWFLGRQTGGSEQHQQRQDSHEILLERVSAEDIISLVGNAQRQHEQHEQKQPSRTSLKSLHDRNHQHDLKKAAESSEIIATVTQSYTSVNPDGSTRTVRRFKKTFADGREECSEDISEHPAGKLGALQGQLAQPARAWLSSSSVPSKPSITEELAKKNSSSSGWFWR